MAGTKISALTTGTLTSASTFVVVTGGVNYKTTLASIISFLKDVDTWDSSDLVSGIYSHNHTLGTTDVKVELWRKSGSDWVKQNCDGIASVKSTTQVQFNIGSIGSDEYKSIISLV